ncbi:hypothetical protein B0H11DRAFT_2104215 [Mycena galericulata]|nr:hypothetical protein B0H11DRAFT_2104215 [Mycena galericulata]
MAKTLLLELDLAAFLSEHGTAEREDVVPAAAPVDPLSSACSPAPDQLDEAATRKASGDLIHETVTAGETGPC